MTQEQESLADLMGEQMKEHKNHHDHQERRPRSR